ncbi:MAG: hypothetical protein CMF74_09875 [Maricaulis sp.]|nr:hypothetical protein [Maricaulis sp.]
MTRSTCLPRTAFRSGSWVIGPGRLRCRPACLSPRNQFAAGSIVYRRYSFASEPSLAGISVMKKWIALMLAASSLALTACNTIQGFGRDVEATGDAIEDAAD